MYGGNLSYEKHLRHTFEVVGAVERRIVKFQVETYLKAPTTDRGTTLSIVLLHSKMEVTAILTITSTFSFFVEVLIMAEAREHCCKLEALMMLIQCSP